MLRPVVLLTFALAAHCSKEELTSVFPLSLSKQTTASKVFFESLAASPTSLDGTSLNAKLTMAPRFNTCFDAKLLPAAADCCLPAADCAALTCTSQCKASLQKVLSTLDGSCCKELGAGTPAEKMCQGQMTDLIVPMVRAKIAAECPSVFFESLAAAPTSLDDTSFKTCIDAKLLPAKADCGAETCTSQCRASLEKVLPTLDGSCCDELAGTPQETTCQDHVINMIVPTIRAKIAAECPSVFFQSLTVQSTSLDVASFKACLGAKLEDARVDCSGESCTAQCRAAVDKVLSKVDGSCCTDLGEGEYQEQECRDEVTDVVLPELHYRIAKQCPSTVHEVSALKANAPAAGLGMFVLVAVAFAGGAITVAVSTVISRRREIVASPLLG